MTIPYTGTKMEATDWAYLAGLIDADGSIFIGRYQAKAGGKYYYREVVSMSNTSENIMKWIVDNTGRGTYHVDNRKVKNAKPRYKWTVTHRNARAILEEIYPYLKIKLLNAEDVMS